VTAARTAFGVDAFDRAWAAGQALGTHEAVAMALRG
jgi:hypothetical protein